MYSLYATGSAAKVSASTQNQALSALLFLYRHVLGREIGDPGEVVRARKPVHLPVVMTREEVEAVHSGIPSPRICRRAAELPRRKSGIFVRSRRYRAIKMSKQQ